VVLINKRLFHWAGWARKKKIDFVIGNSSGGIAKRLFMD
jgi:hypothetical protein